MNFQSSYNCNLFIIVLCFTQISAHVIRRSHMKDGGTAPAGDLPNVEYKKVLSLCTRLRNSQQSSQPDKNPAPTDQLIIQLCAQLSPSKSLSKT